MSAFLLDCLATAGRAALGICLATLGIIALLALWHFCQGLGAALDQAKKERTRQP